MTERMVRTRVGRKWEWVMVRAMTQEEAEWLAAELPSSDSATKEYADIAALLAAANE